MAKGNTIMDMYLLLLCFTRSASLLCAGGTGGHVPKAGAFHIGFASGKMRRGFAELLNWCRNLASGRLSHLSRVWCTCATDVLDLSGDMGNLIWHLRFFRK